MIFIFNIFHKNTVTPIIKNSHKNINFVTIKFFHADLKIGND